MRPRALLVASLLCGASAALVAACTGPLVEFECAPGREVCNGRCVPAGTCRAATTCDSGDCDDDASARVGDRDGASPVGDRDAAAPVGDVDAGPVGPAEDAGPGTIDDDDASSPVVDPIWPRDPLPRPLWPGTGGDPELPPGSTPLCAPPLVACLNECVDLATDADHCGSCSNACATGICRDGLCEASYPGHLVLLGHDFRVVRDGPARVLSNAVLLAPGAEVRVATFAGAARPAAVSGAWRAIDARAASAGRTARRVDVDEAGVPELLDSVGVLLVASQAGATHAHLDALGAEWSEPLARFLSRGGVVVVLDGGTDETWRIVSAAGLAAVRASRDVSGDVLTVGTAADALATGVPVRYRAERSSACFETDEPGMVVLGSCGPVVLHRAVTH